MASLLLIVQWGRLTLELERASYKTICTVLVLRHTVDCLGYTWWDPMARRTTFTTVNLQTAGPWELWIARVYPAKTTQRYWFVREDGKDKISHCFHLWIISYNNFGWITHHCKKNSAGTTNSMLTFWVASQCARTFVQSAAKLQIQYLNTFWSPLQPLSYKALIDWP